jgi:aspartyl protease family protein
MRRPALRLVIGALALAACATAQAQAVALQGMLGSKALLIIDGGTPRTMAPGDTHQGVRLVSAGGNQAVVEVGGRRHTLLLGQAPASVSGGAPAPPRGTTIVMTAGTGGHFFAQGTINGGTVRFVVDTGATSVALSAADAQRVGLDYQAGQPVNLNTANGVARGWRLKLASVRVGDVELFEVDAVVSPQPMPYVLLGNSFLGRFQMKRDNDQMVLERRY